MYNLGRSNAARFLASKTAVRTHLLITGTTLSIATPASNLKKGDRDLLVVRAANHKKLLASTIGTIG